MFLVLIAVVAGLAWYLATGENPWDRGIPERMKAGERLSIRDNIVGGLWLAAVLNLVLAMGLLALAKFWGRKTEPLSPPPVTPVQAVPNRWFWIAVLIAVIVGGWIRAPRLNQSLWNDEEQAFRKFTWGQHAVIEGEDGKERLEFRPTGWDRALFYSVNGNNHVVHTTAAKALHGLWRKFQDDGEERFNLAVIRTEPFLSGLLAIIMIAVWLRGIGFPVAGAAASWLLALHPWHLRYSVEARGYSALLLFVILAFLFLGLALRTKRWRWWLAYGASQSLYLLCFAGAVYLAVAVNLVALGTLILRRDGIGFWRWLVACVLGAMLFLQVMVAPALRFMEWVEDPDVLPFSMDLAFFRDFWSHLLMGTPWTSGNPDLHRFTSFRDEAARSGIRTFGLKIWLPLLLVGGAFFSAWRNVELRRFFGSLLLAAVIIWIHNILSDLTFFVWYALYLLLGFVVALALVPEWVAGTWGGKRGALTVATAGAVLVVTSYAWLTHEPRSRLRDFDRHPMQQAVKLVRGESPALGENQRDLLTASVGSGANQLQTYDPWLTWLKKASDLDAVMAESRETGKPLVVYCCSPRQVERQMGELFATLEDRATFDVELHESLIGLEEYWSFRIYRLRDKNESGDSGR